jgi:hypothetical protein
MHLIKDCRGYSLTFWTIFFGFVLIPILALSGMPESSILGLITK